MNAADLRVELMAAEAALWTPTALRWMRERYPVRDLLDHAPGLGLARVQVDGSHYQPIDGGNPAVIAAVWALPPRDIGDDLRTPGVLIDLGAIDMHTGSVALRRGVAFALGEHMLGTDDQPHRVACYLDGLAWLGAGGAGIVPLDWHAVAREAAGVDLACESVEAGETVYRRLAETLPRQPRVVVREQRRAAA